MNGRIHAKLFIVMVSSSEKRPGNSEALL